MYSNDQCNRSHFFFLMRESLQPPQLEEISPDLLSASIREGVQGVLHRSRACPDFSKNMRHRLAKMYYAVTAANVRNLQALDELEASLSEKKLSVLVIKGAALIEDIYPDIGLRPMEDIDLLISGDGKSVLEEVLAGLGYYRDVTFPHLFRRGRVTIDIHTHPLNADRISCRQLLTTLNYASLSRRSIPLKAGFTYLHRA